MEWKVNGAVGPEANRWVSEQIELPAEFRLRAPYKVSQAVFKWEKGKDSLVRGTLLSPLGPRVSVDLVLGPETVVVNDLSIEDEASKASFGLKEAEGAFSAAFRGGLEKATLDDLLQDNQILTGRIEGNLETKILMDHPMESEATGTLRGEGLSLSLPLGVPVILEDFSLRAQGSQLTIERARLMQEEEEFVLGGDVSFSSEGVVLDMDLLAGDLDWDYIQEALGLEEEADDALQQADSGNQNSLDSLTVEGVVRVKADTFTFEQFTWRPVVVEILLQQEGFEILLKETDLCGVSTTGTVKVLPEAAGHRSRNLMPGRKDRECPRLHPNRCGGNRGFQFQGESFRKGAIRGPPAMASRRFRTRLPERYDSSRSLPLRCPRLYQYERHLQPETP